jgi:hypothetical protein
MAQLGLWVFDARIEMHVELGEHHKSSPPSQGLALSLQWHRLIPCSWQALIRMLEVRTRWYDNQ